MVTLIIGNCGSTYFIYNLWSTGYKSQGMSSMNVKPANYTAFHTPVPQDIPNVPHFSLPPSFLIAGYQLMLKSLSITCNMTEWRNSPWQKKYSHGVENSMYIEYWKDFGIWSKERASLGTYWPWNMKLIHLLSKVAPFKFWCACSQTAVPRHKSWQVKNVYVSVGFTNCLKN